VGEGRFDAKWVKDVLENRERVSESLVFPARGLTLVGVEYPAEDQLEARAKETIARRDED
jgi:tRNA pseudouridine38-40 synthase